MDPKLPLNHSIQPESGTAVVSWHMNEELLKLLNTHGIEHPQLLLVSAPVDDAYHPSKEKRELVPLTRGLGYISFLSEGSNAIHAMIVWAERRKADLPEETFLTRQNGHWKTDVLSRIGDRFLKVFNLPPRCANDIERFGIGQRLEPVPEELYSFAITARDDVFVSAEAFAKPAPEWEQAWVNCWFRNPPTDECEYRKRRFWAYSLQIPLMFANWALRIFLALVGLLAGFKPTNWRPLTHLLSTDMENLMENFQHGNFFAPKSWDKHLITRVLKPGLIAFTPIALLFTSWMTYIFTRFTPSTTTATTNYTIAVGLVALIFVLIAGGVEIIIAFSHLSSKSEVIKAPPVYLQPKTLAFLTEEPTAPRTYENIPWERRTFSLWFDDTKARICKPFSH